MSQSQKISGLYAICDTSFSPQYSHPELAELILQGGCKLLQLRMKGEKDLAKVRANTEQILALKNKYDFTFILNDYVDLAAEIPVDGVHVGQDDLSIAETRKKVGSKKIIGYSSHSLDEAIAGEKAGADYVALGAIFPTQTKGPGHPVQGLPILQQVVQSLKVPVVAIGGITLANLKSVVECKAAAFAVITALSKAPNVAQATRNFLDLLSNS